MSTEQPPSIYEALAAVMAEVHPVGKDSRNPQGGYNFRGIDAVVNAVSPALRNHGVIVVPQISDYIYGEILVGKNRTPMGHARVMVNYTFYGPRGDSIVCSTPGEAFDSGDKATPKAMSVAFRTALLQALCLPTDEVDVDATNYQRAEASPPDVDRETGEVRRPEPSADAQRKRYHALRERLGWDEEEGHKLISEMSKGGIVRWRDIPTSDARSMVLDEMQKRVDELGASFPKEG